jgi:hypothetical protein
MNVLLVRWDTKPDKRIRGTFLDLDRHAERLSMPLSCSRTCRDPCIGLSDSFAQCLRGPLTTLQISLALGGLVYDPSDAVGRLLVNVLAMVAQFESDLIRLRTREGMKVAKATGRLRGKQPKLNRRQAAHLVSLMRRGECRTAEVAEPFGVDRSTVYRAIERQRVEARAGLAEAS